MGTPGHLMYLKLAILESNVITPK